MAGLELGGRENLAEAPCRNFGLCRVFCAILRERFLILLAL
ncbi:hypothetical protein CAMRE0001_1292 [Campylobacter rectus RM3267]|uniref:Uncharacterized protein n=1 Tax=Campylobacter rectus RM3267 TaxID=553218 RepID=B9CZY4_CAMRE|nr:hypothetical protein CAMRE0001_1292 [Campylobacter rectus RM3267]